MKFKVGDKVRLKSLEECKKINEELNGPNITSDMEKYFGEYMLLGRQVCGRWDLEGSGYSWMPEWFEVGEIKSAKTESITWNFKDSDVDLDQICLDALEEKRITWLVVGGGFCHVGVLGSELCMEADDYVLDKVDDYPYQIYSVPLSTIPWWIKNLEKYAENYKVWATENKKKIPDRTRDKEYVKFKAMMW